MRVVPVDHGTVCESCTRCNLVQPRGTRAARGCVWRKTTVLVPPPQSDDSFFSWITGTHGGEMACFLLLRARARYIQQKYTRTILHYIIFLVCCAVCLSSSINIFQIPVYIGSYLSP